MTALSSLQDNGRSSLFEKLSPEHRRRIDIAILERCPPTFQAVWVELRLSAFGITYSSFYRYARRLRDRANLAELADLSDDDFDINEHIHGIIARRLLELLMRDEEASPRDIATLTSALRRIRNIAVQSPNPQAPPSVTRVRPRLDRSQLRLRADELQKTLKQLAAVAPRNHPDPATARTDHSDSDTRPSQALQVESKSNDEKVLKKGG